MDADVLVVGAGITGLMAANLLQKSGLSVIVLDKSASVGGRLETRSIGPGRADLGAQFFTARTPDFRNWVEQWEHEKLVYTWSIGWSDGSLQKPGGDGHPRYAVYGGMKALAKHLAQDLDSVRLNIEILTLTATHDSWLIQDADGNILSGKALVMTPPVPIALELLRSGATPLSKDNQEALEQVQYAPCLCGVFWVEGTMHLPEPGAVQRHNAPISWIADNQRKGISREATVLTVHASPEYSEQLWLVSDDDVLGAMRPAFKPYMDAEARIREAQVERWRYSIPTVTHPERCLLADGLPPLVFAGDAFGGPRVEGAALSGVAAGKLLLSKLA